jgi:FKBP-type peptidyl-prolyl cis-trans isomerase
MLRLVFRAGAAAHDCSGATAEGGYKERGAEWPAKQRSSLEMRLTLTAMLAVALLTSPAFAAGDLLSAASNDAYLAANAKKAGVVTVPGIQYQAIKSGRGAQPGRHDCVTVNYKGTLIDGKVFDQTKPGQPATFPAGALIPGWVEALQMMHAGDKWKLVIPGGLAYGKTGAGDGLIPPNQTLVFEIELLKVTTPTSAGCG